MRWGNFEQIWEESWRPRAAGLTPIKLNAVVTAGYNEADVVDLARLTVERDWHVRFIELMPLGGGECATLSIKRYVSNIETRRRIEAALGPLTEIAAEQSRPTRRAITGCPTASGVVGFISPVSEPYCGTCNRMRLTADGKFHLCLLNDDEIDVRKALRSANGAAARRGRDNSGARRRGQADRPSSARRPLDPGSLDVLLGFKGIRTGRAKEFKVFSPSKANLTAKLTATSTKSTVERAHDASPASAAAILSAASTCRVGRLWL